MNPNVFFMLTHFRHLNIYATITFVSVAREIFDDLIGIWIVFTGCLKMEFKLWIHFCSMYIVTFMERQYGLSNILDTTPKTSQQVNDVLTMTCENFTGVIFDTVFDICNVRFKAIGLYESWASLTSLIFTRSKRKTHIGCSSHCSYEWWTSFTWIHNHTGITLSRTKNPPCWEIQNNNPFLTANAVISVLSTHVILT